MRYNSNKNKIKKIITVIVILAVIAGAIAGFIKWKKGKSESTVTDVSFSTVTRGAVEKTISGSGTVEPYERYEIIPLVNGEIIECPYEVGDYIEKGAVVYSFDMTDALLNFEKQNNSMEKSTITYNEAMKEQEKLTVKAPAEGRVTKLNVEKGDEVSANQVIATIVDDVNLSVKIPFNGEQISAISEGSTATLSSSTQMSNFSGTVSYVDTTASATEDGSSVYYVTVDFKNPGAVADGTKLGAEINGNISPGFGTVSFGEEKQIKTEAAGTVSALNIAEGAYVNKDETVASIKSTTIENSIKKSKIEYEDAFLSLQSQKDSLNDYKITAPISGTVLTKNSKKGDTIDRTNSSVTMMVLGDVSKLKFSLSIDELDVAQVSTGLKVKITSDAIPDEEFEGEITGISMEGAASNGVTTYDATVTINNPGNLKPSMNVDAVIVLDSVDNAVRVASSDIITAMGRHFVFVEDPDGSIAKEMEEKAANQPPSGFPGSGRPQNNGDSMPQGGRPQNAGNGMPQGGRPQNAGSGMPQGERPQSAGSGMPQSERQQNTEGEKSAAGKRPRQPQAPEGFATVQVQIGLEGDEFTQIISGVEEGQRIYQQKTSTSSGFGGFGGMPGGMGGMRGGMGGGMPGGMGGGMPGGMRR